MAAAILLTILLSLLLLAGTAIFFLQRKRLYLQAEAAVSGYLDQ